MSYTLHKDISMIVADDCKTIPLLLQHQADVIIVGGKVIKNRYGGINGKPPH